ncbi:hypothetical protein BC940DRAFT_297921 [Gongronella butleri]|nr:hypothetical protein BC940DRAFT_297921 [Gongronella butleri]
MDPGKDKSNTPDCCDTVQADIPPSSITHCGLPMQPYVMDGDAMRLKPRRPKASKASSSSKGANGLPPQVREARNYCRNPVKHAHQYVTVPRLKCFFKWDYQVIDVSICPKCNHDAAGGTANPDETLAMLFYHGLFPSKAYEPDAYFDVALLQHFLDICNRGDPNTPCEVFRREFAKHCSTPLPKSFDSAFEEFALVSGAVIPHLVNSES